MSDRQQVVVEGGVDHMIGRLVDIIGQTHPATLELAYDRVGTPLGDGEEPGPDDAVRWTATVTWIGRSPVIGEHVVQPGKNPGAGPVYALTRVIEQLGGNVVLVDMSDRSDPR